MNVFISYPSEDRATGERLRFALEAQGHDVFFDRDDLTHGHEYDMAIARGIEDCDLFVFLITPGSVTTGRYTLTELKLAQEKWPHAGGRVLPVLLRSTDINTIPAYLKAVNLLQPQGDAAAEIASAVQKMARHLSWPARIARGVRTRWGAAAVSAGAVVVFLAIAASTDRWPFTGAGAAPDSVSAPAMPDSASLLAARAQPLADVIRQRARAVAPASRGEYVVAVASPAQLQRFTASGEPIGGPMTIEGEPVAAVSAPTQIMLITRAPDGVTVFHKDDLRVLGRAVLDPANVRKPPEVQSLPRLSGDIKSVTALNGMLWIVTGERDGKPAVLRYRTQEQQWEVPSWSARPEGVIGADARGMSLRPFPDGLWAVTTTTTPSSLYHFMGFVRIDEFGGHDMKMVSCAHDLAKSSTGNLLFLSCDNELQEVSVAGLELRLLRARRTLPSESAAGNWTDEIIIADSSATIVALNTHVNQPNHRPGRARIVELDSADAVTTLLDRADAVVHSMAATPSAVIAVLRLAAGGFDAVRIRRGVIP